MISDLGLLTNIVPGQPGLGIRKCSLRLSTAFLVVANDQVELIMTRVLLLLGNTFLSFLSLPLSLYLSDADPGAGIGLVIIRMVNKVHIIIPPSHNRRCVQ